MTLWYLLYLHPMVLAHLQEMPLVAGSLVEQEVTRGPVDQQLRLYIGIVPVRRELRRRAGAWAPRYQLGDLRRHLRAQLALLLQKPRGSSPETLIDAERAFAPCLFIRVAQRREVSLDGQGITSTKGAGEGTDGRG